MIQMRPIDAYFFLLILSISLSNCFVLLTGLPEAGFGNGIVDLGGLLISETKVFTEIWRIDQGGADNKGVTFYEPYVLPDGFYMLGTHVNSNNKDLSSHVLAGKDVTNEGGILHIPNDYYLAANINQNNGAAYIWMPIPQEGYTAIGTVVTRSSEKPPLDKIRCVRSDFVVVQGNANWMWGANDNNSNPFDIFNSIAYGGGNRAVVSTGSFLCNTQSVPYLKNVGGTVSSMPNITQIDDLMKKYSPVTYFHPDEEFFPSTVDWFFNNGGLLYTKGPDSNPILVGAAEASNLPQGGSDDGLYWIDLPHDDNARARVKAGNLGSANAYIHIKPMVGGTFTDIAIFTFYPFNGAGKLKLLFLHINFKRVGEHVSDWEHVTLRISNFDGQLKSVYYSQHRKGVWIDASEIEYISNDKPLVYSSLRGHAAYPHAGENLNGKGGIGIRNLAAKGERFMDTGFNYEIISADYLNPPIVEPFWLNYARAWGPKIVYDIAIEMGAISNLMPGKLKKLYRRFLEKLPDEIFGQEGPLGPKFKDNWDGDERA